MYQRKSTKGVKRGPYRRTSNRFDLQVAKVFSARLRELGIAATRLVEDSNGEVSPPTMSRILNGNGSTNINKIAAVADMLGLEIVFRPKQTDNEDKD